MSCGLDLWDSFPVRRMDSRLLLGWAKHVKCMEIFDDTLPISGMNLFLEAATSMAELRIFSGTPLGAARVDHGLSTTCFTALSKLHLWGAAKPSIIPLMVSDLSAEFACSDEGVPWDSSQVDCFICRLARLPLLHTLSLSFYSGFGDDDYVELERIACPIQLHKLQALRVNVNLHSHTRLDLEWLQRQPCSLLEVGITIFTSGLAHHSALLLQLGRLEVSHLYLTVMAAWAQSAQKLWASLAVKALRLHISSHKAFALPSTALAALPRCSGRTIIFAPDDSDHIRLYIDWAALTRHGADIAIDLADDRELHVLGAGCCAPDHLQQPWQLLVKRARSVHGLPPSQSSGGPHYFLQNAAACAAGWVKQDVDCMHDRV